MPGFHPATCAHRGTCEPGSSLSPEIPQDQVLAEPSQLGFALYFWQEAFQRLHGFSFLSFFLFFFSGCWKGSCNAAAAAPGPMLPGPPPPARLTAARPRGSAGATDGSHPAAAAGPLRSAVPGPAAFAGAKLTGASSKRDKSRLL